MSRFLDSGESCCIIHVWENFIEVPVIIFVCCRLCASERRPECASDKKADHYILEMQVENNIIQNQLLRKDKIVEKRAGIRRWLIITQASSTINLVSTFGC